MPQTWSSRWSLPLLFGLAGACTSSSAPPKGQLMVSLSTDMSVPKDVSVIRVKVKLGAEVREEYDFRLSPDGEFHIPGTVAVVEGSTPAPTVTVEVVGIRTSKGASQARTFSKAITTIPRERTALLRMPVEWLCDGQVADDGSDEYLSSCDLDADGNETACVAGTCQPVHLESNLLPTFSSRDVFGGGATPTDPNGRCFDTLTCFDAGSDVSEGALDANCSLTLPDDGSTPNFALSFPGNGDGICHDDPTKPCYVPLDQDPRTGWTFASNPPAGKRVAVLPAATCTSLKTDRAHALRLTTACATKTPASPTCGAWSTVTTPAAPTTDGGSTGGLGGTGGTDGGMAGVIDNGAAGPNGGSGGTTSKQGGSGGTASQQGGTGGTDPGTGGSSAGTTAQGGTGTAGTSAGGTAGDLGGVANGGDSGAGNTGPTSPTPCPGAVTFASPGLEGIVREHLNKPTGTLTGDDVATIVNLAANSNGVTALDGMECLVNLQTASFSNNTISDLTPLAGLTQLTFLDVSFNQVTTTAPLASIAPHLDTLALNDNPLTDLSGLADAAGLVNVTDTQVANLAPLTGNVAITTFYAANTPITDASVLATFTALTTLDLSATLLTSYSSLAGLPSTLTTLALNQTNGADLTPLGSLTTLTSLNLSNAGVTSIAPLATLTKLTSLMAVGNQLTSLTGVATLTSLHSLSLAGNQLTDLTPLTGLTVLTDLELSSNPTVDISSLVGMTSLVNLGLADDLLTSVAPLSGLVNIQTLKLTDNVLTTIDPLLDDPGLGTDDMVILDGNPICNTSGIDTLRGRGVTVQFNTTPAC